MISFECQESDKGVVDRGSCEGKQVVCGRVANKDKRHTGNACSSLGNVRHGNMSSKMILLMRGIGGEGGRVLGERKILLGDG